MMNIALIGPPGAGKGTQAETLKSEFGLDHLSTGMLFREHLAEQTALGLLARRYIRDGALVPDEIVDAMVEERVRKQDASTGILFDGFPRTLYQARFLDDLSVALSRPLDAVIYLNVTDDVIVERLQGREICKDCQTPYHTQHRTPTQPGICDHCGGRLYRRDDDHSAIVRNRLTTSHHLLGKLAEHYQQAGKLIVVDGDDVIPIVAAAVAEAVRAVAAGTATIATEQDAERIRTHHRTSPILTENETEHQGLDLVLLGGPGSGKGTQAVHLRDHFAIPHVASGDLFRENLKNQTELGKLASNYIRHGELVPDDITFSMVHERLRQPDTQDGFILDGFPRNLHQAHSLANMMNDMQRRLSGVLYMKVSDEEIIRRITGRMICRVCQAPFHREYKPPKQDGICDVCGGELYQREDDNLETVAARLKTFHEQTEPLLDFYRDQGVLVEIAGEGAPDEVTTKMIAAAETAERDISESV